MPRPLKEKTLAPGAGAWVAMTSSAAWFRFRSRLRGLKTQLINKAPRLLKEVAPWAGAWMAVVAFVNYLLGDLNIQLIGMAVTWLALIILQCILGLRRRYSEHWLVQHGSMAGYYLQFPLALRAVNTALHSSETRMEHTALCFLLPIFSCYFLMSGPMPSAYTRPFQPYAGRIFQVIISCYYLLSLAIERDPDNNGRGTLVSPNVIKYIYTLMLVALLVAFSMRISRITLTREERAREFAVYMQERADSQQGPSCFFELDFDGNANDSLLGRCKYPIMLNAAHPISGNLQSFKIDRVMDVRGYFRINDPDDRPVPDIFLSYSFFQMLARRYFEFDCAEEGNQEVRDFALKELMQQDYKRAFTVVEAQLAFLHDEFFFTDRWNLADGKAFQVGPAVMFLALNTLGIWRESSLSSPIPSTVYACYASTAILAGLVLGFCEMGLWIASDWYTIGMAIKIGRLFASPRLNMNWNWFRQPYWKNKIGQYSLIQDYDSCSAKKMSQFLLKSIMSCEWPANFINKHYPVEEAALALSVPDHDDSVRALVAHTLQGINGPPTNGINSLHRNRVRIMDDLSWTCRQATDTHTILIWHIATCYLELGSKETSTDYKVATALSRYCAYLVAFDPEFIPQDRLKPTQAVFQDVLKEAKEHLPMDQETPRMIWKYLQKVKGFLGSRKEMSKEKRIKMEELDLTPEETMRMSTFEKGVLLGRQLERLEDTSLRWEVMAEFWSEMILYIATSDNVALHFEHLAKGGEFVTHLWAMLSNAGILKQARGGPQPTRDEEMNQQQPEPAAAPVTSE